MTAVSWVKILMITWGNPTEKIINAAHSAAVSRRAMAATRRMGSISFLPQSWAESTTAPEPRPMQMNWNRE